MPAASASSKRRLVRNAGLTCAVLLSTVGIFLVVLGKTPKMMSIGIVVGLWGILVGYLATGEPRRRQHSDYVDEDGVDHGAQLAMIDDFRERYEMQLEVMLRREIERVLRDELASLRGEVSGLRGEMNEKFDGQLRLERIETTRVIGSDIQSLQAEVRRLAVKREEAIDVDAWSTSTTSAGPPPAINSGANGVSVNGGSSSSGSNGASPLNGSPLNGPPLNGSSLYGAPLYGTNGASAPTPAPTTAPAPSSAPAPTTAPAPMPTAQAAPAPMPTAQAAPAPAAPIVAAPAAATPSVPPVASPPAPNPYLSANTPTVPPATPPASPRFAPPTPSIPTAAPTAPAAPTAQATPTIPPAPRVTPAPVAAAPKIVPPPAVPPLPSPIPEAAPSKAAGWDPFADMPRIGVFSSPDLLPDEPEAAPYEGHRRSRDDDSIEDEKPSRGRRRRADGEDNEVLNRLLGH